MMVFLTGLALFAFVVLPVVDSYMRRGMAGGGTDVVARFDDTVLTSSRVEYFTRNHQSTVRFLVELAELTIKRGGYPKTAGFRYDEQNGQVMAIGINQSPSADSTIRTLMLAAEAQKAGFDLDDSSLRRWLERYTGEMISGNDIDALLMRSTNNQMGRPHLYEQLRSHLLATVYLTRGYSTLYMGESPATGALVTPEEQWSNFLKLNRTAVATAYPVMVDDYLDQTNKNPSESEILATFEEGKEVDPNDQSPDPAFHRRYAAKFEYLVGDYQDFLNAEIEKLSEEDIRAEYDRRLKGGDFQLPENSAADMLKELQESEQPAQTGEAEADAGDKANDPKPETADEAAEEGEAPAEDATTEAAPADATETASEESESADEGGAETDQSQSNLNRDQATRLVALQQEEGEAAADAGQTAAEETSAAAEAKAEQQEQPAKADDSSNDAEPAKADEAESKGDDEKAAETKEEPSKEDEPKPEDSEPKVEAYEDVRDQIAESLAGPAARQNMDRLINEINNQLQLYFNKRAIHESYVEIGEAGKAPVKPDLKEIAENSLMTYEVIGPYTEVTIAEEPIANSRDVGTQFGGRGPGFSVIMYGFNNGQTELPRQQLFVPVRTADDPAGKIYVSWKIEETEAYTPTLAEARDEVVMAIRRKEARKLARAAADEIAKQAAEASDKPLRELVPEDKRDRIVDAGAAPSQPFKWLDMIPGFGVAPGNVPELDSVGNDFMEAVFTTKIGGVAVAANDPERVIYVVQPTKLEPSLEELQLQYQQPVNRMMANFIGNDTGGILSDFYKSVDEQAGLVNYLETEMQ